MNATPLTLTPDEAGPQSLATGTAGAALLHIERALTGTGTWADADACIRQITGGPVDAGLHAGLFYGAPALSFVLHAAGADGHPRYHSAVAALDRHVERLAQRRVAFAAERMGRGGAATFGEYDLFYGLVGLGVLLLRHQPGSDALAGILRYLTRLTCPRRDDDGVLPGWWVTHNPDPSLPTPGGHANLGMAHGAAGLLAFLAHATSQGYVVDGQHGALGRLIDWFDTWRQDSETGPWWPQWLTRDELRLGRPLHPAPGRPSWCYGTPGIARAQQLAALATHDPVRRLRAEDALASALTSTRLPQITDAGLCHGIAGVYQTAFRAAADAATPELGNRLAALATALRRRAERPSDETGLLTGQTGVDLALHSAQHATPPLSGWDACLLIS